MLAAREGHDAGLQAAIAFFREVDASAYLDEAKAKALLATTRSA